MIWYHIVSMKTNFMSVIFTNHAIQRLCERKITQSDAWYTFRHSDKQSQGLTPGSYLYSKTYGPQTIEVVAKQNEKKEWVVLSVWSKLIGNNQPIFTQKKENWLWKFLKRKFKEWKEKREHQRKYTSKA